MSTPGDTIPQQYMTDYILARWIASTSAECKGSPTLSLVHHCSITSIGFSVHSIIFQPTIDQNDGCCSKSDIEKRQVLDLYTKSAEGGFAPALFNLGTWHVSIHAIPHYDMIHRVFSGERFPCVWVQWHGNEQNKTLAVQAVR